MCESSVEFSHSLDGGPFSTARRQLDLLLDLRFLLRHGARAGALDVGALTVADGVVYAGSLASRRENMYALDDATGAAKWAFASGGSVAGGAAVVDGTGYWGSGYKIGGINGSNNELSALGVAGK